jgi:hypothetical protein
MSGHPDSTPRHGFRFRLGIPAELYAENRTFSCEARNISRSGALIVGQIPAPTTTLLALALKLPASAVSVRLSGKVVRVEPGADGESIGIAIEFVDMDDARRDELEVLLARCLETPAHSPLESLKPGSSLQDVRKTLDSIPIPQRIALASRAVQKEREFLRFDTNPAVLEALAHNPNLTLVEARALAASAYLMPGTIDVLANDSRFKHDDDLRMTLAIHPKVPSATADKLTSELKVPQIKVLLTKPGVSQALREKLFRRTTRG